MEGIDFNNTSDVLVIQDDLFLHQLLDDSAIIVESENLIRENQLADNSTTENIVLEIQDTVENNTENDIVISPLVQVENRKEENGGEKILSRKRKRNVADCKTSVRKTLRQSGREYIDKRKKKHAARNFNYKICTKCPFKCSEKISEDIAHEIFTEFWKLTDDEKFNFYDKTTTKIPKKRVRKENLNSSRPRGYSYVFRFFITDQEVRVCRDFYLNVLSISSRRVSYFHSQKKTGITNTPKKDQRGKKTKIKISEDSRLLVKEHINSFPRVPGHYCRQNTKKEYLEFGLNLTKMYELYQEDCQIKDIVPVKKWLYTKIFNEEFNIEFYIPKKDQCDLCCEHENQKKLNKVTKELEEKFAKHVKEKQYARAQKNMDKVSMTENTALICFDLQRVLNIPQSNVSKAYYLQKLNMFNLTVCDVARKQGYCIIWHEGISGRAGNDIASALVQMLCKFVQKNPTITNIVLWSDACVPQNRNSHMSTALISFLNKENHNVLTIEQKFQEPGHSCVQEVDSIHSTIDKAFSRADINSPLDLIRKLLRVRSKNPYEVYQMKKENFKNYQDVAVNTNLKKIPYSKVKHIIYEKGNNMVKYKTTFTEEELQVVNIQIKKKLRNNTDEDILPVPKVIGATKIISEDKINSIRSLYPQFSATDIEFWETIFKQPESSKETKDKKTKNDMKKNLNKTKNTKKTTNKKNA